MENFSISLEEIKAAARRLRDTVVRTPLLPHTNDGETEIRLKAENLQPTGSFKIRGATNAVAALDPAHLKAGIYAASAGNFGLGLALAARKIGIPARVYVPDTAARVKTDALEELGATVIRQSQDDWWQIMMNRKAEGEEGIFLHPCADPAVVIGNATIGMEIVEDWPEVEAILVPFGGGGLALGIALGARTLKPDVQVIACESTAATPLRATFDAGTPVTVPFDTTTFINGIGSTRVLDEMWPALHAHIDDVLVVPVSAAEAAIREIARRNHMIAEGAGAVPLATALSGQCPKRRIAAVVSGGNIDSAVLAEILTKG